MASVAPPPIDADALRALQAAAAADTSAPPTASAAAAAVAAAAATADANPAAADGAAEGDGDGDRDRGGDGDGDGAPPAATRRWSWWPGRVGAPAEAAAPPPPAAGAQRPYTRIRKPLLGMDVITVDDPAVIRTLLATGTVERVGAPPGGAATAPPDAVDHLPAWLRRYLPLTRAHPPGGWFLALLPTASPDYAGRRAYLEAKFAPTAPGGVVHADVAAAAAALTTSAAAAAGAPAGAAEAAALEAAFVNAIGRRFHAGAPVPATVVAAAAGGAASPTDALKPWVVWRARRAGATVAAYARACVAADADAVAAGVPPSVASDIAHGVLTTPTHDPGVLLLREAYAEAAAGRWGAAARPVGTLFARLAIVPSVPRLVVTGGDLGGLLAPGEPPAVAGTTVVRLGLGAAAAATGSGDWAWAAGGPERQCVARGAIEAFVAAVRDEVGRRLGIPQGAGRGGGGGGGRKRRAAATGRRSGRRLWRRRRRRRPQSPQRCRRPTEGAPARCPGRARRWRGHRLTQPRPRGDRGGGTAWRVLGCERAAGGGGGGGGGEQVPATTMPRRPAVSSGAPWPGRQVGSPPPFLVRVRVDGRAGGPPAEARCCETEGGAGGGWARAAQQQGVWGDGPCRAGGARFIGLGRGRAGEWRGCDCVASEQ
ncbi:hypothetical protein I4F81_000957 [Pyropia yezoensis]|uniref:Uncharacterized protein n=1 Tax=Pyropia yezoensis TaxID=2788 RepID=A0ACC3BK46_PYRYE|nr:hypothetical protein I4F81_000957 [Neopyropia yezoensis]